MARAAWKEHGVTPGELFDRLTPNQFLLLFEKPAGAGARPPDKVEAIRQLNHARAEKGLRPVLPSWL